MIHPQKFLGQHSRFITFNKSYNKNIKWDYPIKRLEASQHL